MKFKTQIFILLAALALAFSVVITAGATPARPFSLYVAQGNAPGYSWVDKFALNTTITTTSTPEDIWETGGLYTYSADAVFPNVGVADIVSLSSSSALDKQAISIEGLDAGGYGLSQMVTANGQTRVAITPLWRIWRMENMGDTGDDINGTLYAYSGTANTAGVPSGASVIKATIDDGNNQTQMIQYTIPRGFVGFLARKEVGMDFSGGGFFSAAEGTVIQYKVRPYGSVFKIKKTISLISTGTSIYSDYRPAFDPIAELSDLKLVVKSVSASMGIWATFDILLVGESYLSADFLSSIGQSD